MISIGAYKHGTNPQLDEAINKIDAINRFLTQGRKESFPIEETVKMLVDAVSDK